MKIGPSPTDFDVQQHLSIALLQPNSDAGKTWCEEHLVTDDALMWSAAFVVEPRYLEEILRAIVNDGLSLRLHG
ncbi:MAG TPA: hypothetical protein VGC50_10505 [Gammaproteobacteria bacterium]|jgi:hypothetical protein